ncbi:hypothetical protein AB0A69_04225 [Streptomyces sp. NPDC045431]|uniref:hypothetical protein n=1 Tax=Streptomyces sp. NPDC045431 TaxID=3155613 RepID=UPI00340CEA87
MSARTHPRPHATGGVGTRLTWWALTLPVMAFVALLVLITGGGTRGGTGGAEAHATSGDPAVGRILEHIQHTLSP